MTIDLAKNSALEICEEIAANKDQIIGVVAIAFTADGFMCWGMNGMIVPTGMALVLNGIHDAVARMHELWGMPVEGSA